MELRNWILLLPSLLRCCTGPQNWPQHPEPWAACCQQLGSAYRVQGGAGWTQSKVDFCWERVAIFIVYPAALEPLQKSSCSAHLPENTHPAWCCPTSELCPPLQRLSPVATYTPTRSSSNMGTAMEGDPRASSFLCTRNGTGCRWEDLQPGSETYR